ncbi:hypothetical protein ATANTOWER_009922 [Ataeniobius toweri]|uniref:Uncharacterized protein n=1 Tax=Ataeniobius toweri TaxID=208326 RepID=A0ABU7A5N1_9TELE|nr:hypothetical protein [Ataeniobius toweri]
MSRWLKCTSMHFNTDWNKYDDRLMKAVERGEADKVAAVLSKKGIIPTKLDVEGRSAFHLAATRGQLECLNLMLGHNVDITAKDACGKNALHLASKYGYSLCVQKLLQIVGDLSPSLHLLHGNDLLEVVAVGRGLSAVLTSSPSYTPPSILSAVITPPCSGLMPTPSASSISLSQPEPSRYRISPSMLYCQAPLQHPPPRWVI